MKIRKVHVYQVGRRYYHTPQAALRYYALSELSYRVSKRTGHDFSEGDIKCLRLECGCKYYDPEYGSWDFNRHGCVIHGIGGFYNRVAKRFAQMYAPTIDNNIERTGKHYVLFHFDN